MHLFRHVFLALAIWGSIHPMYWFVTFFMANDWSLAALIDSWYVNPGTTGLVWDLTIAALALTLWIIVDAVQRRDWASMLAIPTIYCIGVSCGLPLYIWLRLRPRGARTAEG